MRKIIELRKKTGMSQREFSSKYNIPVRSLQRWEQGQNEVPGYTLNLLETVIDFDKSRRDSLSPPEYLRYAFWDTEFSKINVLKDREYIIARLFTKGGIAGIRWVVENYSDYDIEMAARNRRDLNPIVANYLRGRCGLQKSDMKYYRMNHVDWR